MHTFKYFCWLICLGWLLPAIQANSQELNCKIAVNASQIQGTNNQVFKTLETALNEFMNDRKWTSAQYAIGERIACSMNITVKSYSDDGSFGCELTVQSSRPVYNANYNTIVFNFKDPHFDFKYLEFDQIDFRDNLIDNNLTAVLAYYAYLIIGLDMDTMAPEGGTDLLHAAENIVTAAQNMSETGWKAFDDSRNRHAIVNDYLDPGMSPLRQLMYDYHRTGLDEMAQNADRGRAKITTSLQLLKKAKENKAMSVLPQLFTEFKKEELLNIYSKGTVKEKEEVSDLLMEVNPALSSEWDKIKSAQ